MKGSQNLSSQITNRFPVILAVFGGLVFSVLLGSQIGRGNFVGLYMFIVVSAGGALALAVGRHYWLLLPLAMSLQLPAIPLAGRTVQIPELAISACYIIFMARGALKLQSLRILSLRNIFIIAYMIWVVLVFTQNPVGLMAFGAGEGGLRSYVKLILAFLAFLVVSNQTVSEKDARRIIVFLIAGGAVSAFYSWYRVRTGSGAGIATENAYYTWQQDLIPFAFWTVAYLVSRYPLRAMTGISRPHLSILFFGMLLLALSTGKRAGFASVFALPLMAGFLKKEYARVILLGGFGMIVIAVLVLGHGSVFELPRRIQRTLVYLPGNWDASVSKSTMGGGSDLDTFRARMREKALKEAAKEPLFGSGLGVSKQDASRELGLNKGQLSPELLALGNSWHTTWFGMAADFGIPAALFYAGFMIQALFAGFAAYKKSLSGSNNQILGLMLFLFFVTETLRSYTSGHSANSPFAHWWVYGILVSMLLQRVGREASSTRVAFGGSKQLANIR